MDCPDAEETLRVERVDIVLMYEASAEHLARLERAAPDANFARVADEAAARHAIRDAAAVLGNRFLLQSLPFAKRLQWVQSNSVGMDVILTGIGTAPSFVLTNARGVYDDEIADHAVALALALTRRLHVFRDQQRAGRWERASLPAMSSRRALILGCGGVGRAIAARLRAFGANVRMARRDTNGDALSASEWRGVLPETDLLILALPLTRETRGAVGRAEIASMPPGAIVVNVGRGETLDVAAARDALRSGHLGGLGADVFASEPLPPDDPLWATSGALITPHVSRSVENGSKRWEQLFEENVRRFAAGEPLLNVVDPMKGY